MRWLWPIAMLMLAACDSDDGPAPCDGCIAGPDAQPDGGTDGLPDADSQAPDFGPNKLDNGVACVAGAQCKSGQCVDDVCCADSCTGSCMACNLDGTKGTCSAVPASAGPQQDCAGDPKCGNGVCDGAGGCSYPNAGQPCGSICNGGGKLVVSLCDAAYQCVAQAPASCSPYTCDATANACRTSCTQHQECDPASACDRSAAHTAGTGACVPLAQADTVASGQEIATVVGATTKPVVIVPPGTYKQKIVVSKTIKIIGKGSATSPSKLDPDTDGAAITIQTNGKLTVQGLTIQGATGTGGDGLYCQGSSTTKATLVAVENTIADNKGHGVLGSFCDVTLRRNVIQSNQAGGAKLADGAFVVVNNVVA